MLLVEADKMTTDYEQYLTNWIVNDLSKPEPALNNLPRCPFAKSALLNDKIRFQKSKDYVRDIDQIFSNWDDKIDVVILVCDDDIDPIRFSEDVSKINEKYVPIGYGCLEDHVAVSETVGDISFNNGKYNLILCQPLEKLNAASEYLKPLGYYKHWDKDYFDSVVSWRLPKSS